MNALALFLALQAQTADEFPKNAYVTVQCVAGRNEIPQDCHAVEVSHPGQGMEDAAIAIMRRGRVGERQGVRVGQAYRIKVNFRLAANGEVIGPDTERPHQQPAG